MPRSSHLGNPFTSSPVARRGSGTSIRAEKRTEGFTVMAGPYVGRSTRIPRHVSGGQAPSPVPPFQLFVLRQAEGGDQKHGHLSARRRPVRTEQRRICTAPACDSFMVELLNPRRGESRDRYIIEYRSRGRWRRVRRPVLAPQKENRQLR